MPDKSEPTSSTAQREKKAPGNRNASPAIPLAFVYETRLNEAYAPPPLNRSISQRLESLPRTCDTASAMARTQGIAKEAGTWPNVQNRAPYHVKAPRTNRHAITIENLRDAILARLHVFV
ncbi:MAG: hypothetical protein CMJ47_03925 [Planctomyces sp.]|nr:hypothetical protein [Planctomyces sp.]